jgi:hypothetical protein
MSTPRRIDRRAGVLQTVMAASSPTRRAAGRAAPLVLVAVAAVALALPGVAHARRSWSHGGRLAGARELHTATLLGDGRALIVGGFGHGGALAGANTFDPSTHRFTRVSSMHTPRLAQTATRLPDGRVLVAGGFNAKSGYQSSAEIYDPAHNTWTPAASMATPRADQTATLLPLGRVLVTGGLNRQGALSSAEIYNPYTNSWSPAGSMHGARYHQTATLLPDHDVLVAGGERTHGKGTVALRTAEVYDPRTNRFTLTASMSRRRVNFTATRLASGKVLVAGGGTRAGGFTDTAELYDPATQRWSRAGRMSTPRGLDVAAALPHGRVLVAGGYNDCGAPTSTEVYDAARNRWSRSRDLRTGRANATATAYPDGQVLIAGGATYAGAVLRSSELYRPGAPDHTGPSICDLRVKPRSFRAGRRRRVALRYRLSERAQVTFHLARCTRVRKGECRRFRYVRGRLRARGRAGRDRTPLRGRLRRHTRRPGVYRLTARARDRRGNRGPKVSDDFVVRR